VKTYRQHHCDTRHRTYKTFAKCAWKKRGITVQVVGEGAYASVSRCTELYSLPSYRRVISVHLCTSEAGAQEAKAFIDSIGCGGFCRKQHEVVRLELPT
jgi:hypothetical protein